MGPLRRVLREGTPQPIRKTPKGSHVEPFLKYVARNRTDKNECFYQKEEGVSSFKQTPHYALHYKTVSPYQDEP